MNRQRRYLAGGIAAIALGLGPIASADVIASESFDYSGNTVNGQGAAENGWGGAWTLIQTGPANGHTFSSSTSLSYPDGVGLVSSGGHITGMSDEVATRPLATPIEGNSGDDIWVSVLVRKNTSGAVGFGFEDAGGNRRLSWGFLSDEKMGLNVAGETPNAVRSSATFATDTDLLVVVKITLGNPTDTVSLKVFSPNGAITEPTTFDVTHSNTTNLSFTKFFIKGLTSTAEVDEIRIGDSFADVVPVPEPGSAAMGALGLLMMMRRP